MKSFIIATLLICCAGPSVAQWQERKGNLPIPWGLGMAIDACDNSTAVVTLAEGIWLTSDAGRTWLSLGYPNADGLAWDVSMPDDGHVWVANSAGQILYWNAQTGTWRVEYEDTSVTRFMNYIQMFDTLDGIAMGDAKADSLPAVFLRTSDGGVNWTSVNDSAFGYASGDTWRRLSFPGSSVGYFYESGTNPQKLYATRDGGSHWTVLPFPDTIGVQNLKFYDDQIGLAKGIWSEGASVYGQVIARTLDGGSSWEVFSDSSMHWGNDFEFVPGNPAEVWFTDNNKLYFSADTGRTWMQRWPEGGRDIVFTDSTHGWVLGDDSLLIYTFSGGVTAVRESDSPVPAAFTLFQNYPNPCNPSTTIRYRIPANSIVELKVFDILGREVATLVNEMQRVGEHSVRFDGTGLSSGVYFYTLEAGVYHDARKILLLK